MIIVTGGAGFIGSNLIKSLNDLGEDQILVVDHLGESQKYLNLNSLRIVDYLDKHEFLEQLPNFRNITTIFHQGACSSTTETDGNYMMKNNYQFSKTLLHHCIDHQINFIYASSASVYGNGESGFEENRTCETPLNVYAFSKFMFDNYVRTLLSKVSIQIVGLRYFNVYGYQENHKGSMASVAFHLFHQLQESNQMKLFEGSEKFLRDFVFVEDAINVNLFFYETQKKGIFNCGTGTSRSFLEIAEIMQKLHQSGEIQFIPFPEHLQGKYQRFTQANLSSLREIGYSASFQSLEKSLEKYYRQLQATGGYLTPS